MPLAALPNVLSGLRILLVLPFAWLLLDGRFEFAAALFALAAITDGLDGAIARRFGWQSQLGALLDPAADKLLVAVGMLVLAWLGLLPIWLAALAFARDCVIVLGALAFRRWFGPIAYGATWLGKASTAAQLALIALVVLAAAVPAIGAHAAVLQLTQALILGVAVLALASGGDYVLTWSRKAAAARRGGGA